MDKNTVIVRTKCGQLRGAIERSCEDFEYQAFKGIPYGKPPIGELRFKDPLPFDSWTGIRDATKFGSPCSQLDYFSLTMKGSEDCLYLNVYTKSVNDDEKLPVMVSIHGGVFLYLSGDDDFCGPDYLLRKDIILVTINFRLGIFGFLDLQDEVAPGNQGLKDQILALKWIQDNIENFGGDPNNVTIFGSSSGSSLVHYLTLSPLTKGLFHKAIMESCVASNPWACRSTKKYALQICQSLGNDSTDPKELVEFLRKIDHLELVKLQLNQDEKDSMMNLLTFNPTVDDKSTEPVMPIHPSKAMEKGVNVPIIIGSTTCEGLYVLAKGYTDSHFELLDKNFEDYLPEDFKTVLEENNTTPEQLRRFYFGDEEISRKNLSRFLDFRSDSDFLRELHRVVTCQVKHGSKPAYMYYFTYDKGVSLIKTFSNCFISGTAHFDEMPYLFKMKILDNLNLQTLERGSTSYRMMEVLTELWTNFATFGNPTPSTSELIPVQWLPVTDDKIFEALYIGEELKMDKVTSVEVLTKPS